MNSRNFALVLLPISLLAGCLKVTQTENQKAPVTVALSINSGAEFTNTDAVVLTIAANDATEMYVTNTAGCGSGGFWEGYGVTKGWLLSAQPNTSQAYTNAS